VNKHSDVNRHYPYFSEDETGNAVTVTSDRYVLMVNEFFLPELRHGDMDIATF
jgi:hypothetical protein